MTPKIQLSINRITRLLALVVSSFPQLIVLFSAATAIFCLVYSLLFLKIDSNQDNLISPHLEYQQRYLQYLNEFRDQEYVYIVLESGSRPAEKNIALIDEIVASLSKEKDLFKEVRGHLSIPPQFSKNALLSLSQADFQELTQTIDDLLPLFDEISKEPTYEKIIALTAASLNKGPNVSPQVQTYLYQFLTQLLQTLENPNAVPPAFPFENAFKGLMENVKNNQVYLSEGPFYFVEVMPFKNYSTSGVIDEPLKLIREKIEAIKEKYPDVEIGITGRPVLQSDEMASTGSDSIWAGLASLMGVALLYFFFFRSFKIPLLTILALCFGLCWTLGMITYWYGHLNLITLVFGIILIGIGVDYGIHFLMQFEKEKNRAANLTDALQATYQGTGKSIFLGAVITSLSFITAVFTDFMGLQELGVISAFGLLFCYLAQVILLPALVIVLFPKNNLLLDFDDQFDPSKKIPPFNTDQFLKYGGIATAVLALLIFRVGFENNLLNLQDPDLESVKWEKKIIDQTSQSTWFAVMTSKDRAEIEKWNEEILKRPELFSTKSILDLIPKNQTERISALVNTSDKVEKIQTQLSANSDRSKLTNVSNIRSTLQNFSKQLEEYQNSSFISGKTEDTKEIEKIMAQISNISTLLKKSRKEVDAWATSLSQSQFQFFINLRKNLLTLESYLSPSEIQETSLPRELLERFQGSRASYLLTVYPQKNIWDPGTMKEFVQTLYKINPKVTGAPVQVYESARRMKAGFTLVSFLTLVLVGGVLYLGTRDLRITLIAASPLGIGLIWLLILMGLFGIKLSLANFFAIPILMGLSIDMGLHTVRYYQEEALKDPNSHVMTAVFLSVLTTLIGFFSLSFVSHRGLASFGIIMTLGSITTYIACVLCVPALLKKYGPKSS